MRKIAVITGTRADYGLLYWIIEAIHKNEDLHLQLIVTGMHLSHEFGYTVEVIEKDGFPIAERVEMLLSSDTEKAIASSMGIGMMGFSDVYSRLKPDIIIVLGDRFEILSAVASAVPFKIPVAHIHGGESSEGAMDELFRHAITKMSHIHFAATDIYMKRIVQMGENPDNVYCFGAPGLDNMTKLNLHDREKLYKELELPPEKKLGLLTYHPVTLKNTPARGQIQEILSSIKEFKDFYWIITMPNADTEGRAIINAINDFVTQNSSVAKVYTSLGQLRYLSLLKHAELMIGNSSSGIAEAPSFKLPVVNIGDRQKGRIKAGNIIEVTDCNREAIISAIKKALSKSFIESLNGLKSPYGNGDASLKIVNTLLNKSLSGIIKKHFCDLLN